MQTKFIQNAALCNVYIIVSNFFIKLMISILLGDAMFGEISS